MKNITPDDPYVRKCLEVTAEQLLPMVENGLTSLIIENNRSVRAVMSAHLVEATPDTAWEVLLDYGRYNRFLKLMKVVSHRKVSDDEYHVKFTAGIKVMGVGGSVKNNFKVLVEKPYAYVYDRETGQTRGFWGIYSIDSEDRCILVNADIARNIRDISSFMKMLVDSFPSIEMGIHMSPGAMVVSVLAERMKYIQGRADI